MREWFCDRSRLLTQTSGNKLQIWEVASVDMRSFLEVFFFFLQKFWLTMAPASEAMCIVYTFFSVIIFSAVTVVYIHPPVH